MIYYLPFIGADGNEYHLEGRKHIFQNECLSNIFSPLTTLYFHVREGSLENNGTVLSTGIVMIDFFSGVFELIFSLRVTGNQTIKDDITALLFYGEVVLGDVITLCLTPPTQYQALPLASRQFSKHHKQPVSEEEQQLAIIHHPQTKTVSNSIHFNKKNGLTVLQLADKANKNGWSLSMACAFTEEQDQQSECNVSLQLPSTN